MSTINTPEFRVSYPNVFKSRKNDLSGKEEYSLVALFKKGENLEALKNMALAAITEKWGADKTKWPASMRLPFRKQEDRMKDGALPAGHEEGAVYLNLKNEHKPGVVDAKVQAIIDPSEFYGGCYAIASVRAFAYDQKGNRGVSFSLGNIQKTRDGEAFGNRTKPEQDFKPIAGTEQSAATGTDATKMFD